MMSLSGQRIRFKTGQRIRFKTGQRIRFKTGRMFWLISPVREKEFIEALKAINPNINVQIPEKTGKWRIWDWDI